MSLMMRAIALLKTEVKSAVLIDFKSVKFPTFPSRSACYIAESSRGQNNQKLPLDFKIKLA
jgi:hypothetical protein